MSKEKDTETNRKLHEAAMIGFDHAQSLDADERTQCRQDRRFAVVAGAQYEGGDWEDHFKNRPKMEFNKIQVALKRAYEDYCNNRVSPIFKERPDTEKGLGDTFADLYRADEQACGADEALTNAFKEGLAGGFGAWRLRCRYEDEMSDIDDEEDDDERPQRITFEPIYDADSSVFFNAGAKRQDKADATECWVLHTIPTREYEQKYGNVLPLSSWPSSDVCTWTYDWKTDETVTLCEYYKREKVSYVVNVYVADMMPDVEHDLDEIEENPQIEEDLKSIGYTLARQRKYKRWKVNKWLMSGGGVLEGPQEIAGRAIPIIPYYATYDYIDGVAHYAGMTRYSKDQARLDNMTRSKLAWQSAVSGFEKPIFTPEQISGHANFWANDAKDDFAYLVANAIENPDGSFQLPNPAYTRAPNIPPATIALLQAMDKDRVDMLGDVTQPEKVSPNTSGYAMDIARSAISSRSFVYIENFGRAIKRCAEVWVGMAKDVYIEDSREMQGRDEKGIASKVVLNQPVVDDAGKRYIKNNVAEASLEVSIDVGPSSQSRRDSLIRTISNIWGVETDPQNKSILSAVILKNLEGEGMADVNEYYRKQLVKIGIEQPNDEDKKAMENAPPPQPDPQTEYFKAAAANELAKAQKAQADTALTAVKTEETKAKIIETLASVDISKRDQLMKEIQAAMSLRQADTTPSQPNAGEMRGQQ